MNDIDILTQRYLDGATSLQEERRLAELIDNCPHATEEQKAIALMLRQGVTHSEEEMEQWLAEDETAVYDSMVARRQRRKGMVKWAAAASVAVIVGLSLWLNLPQDRDGMMPTAMQEQPSAGDDTTIRPGDVPAVPCDSVSDVRQLKPKKLVAEADVAGTKKPKTSVTDDFHDAIAYIEARLDAVVDSVAQAQAEQIIATDAQLSRLAYSTEQIPPQ